MQVEMMRVGLLSESEHNARVHSEEQVGQIAESIKKFGFNNPILVDEAGEIIAGHGRVRAAALLGLAEVPCIVLDHLDERQKRAFMLADNRIALNSGWDEDLLRQELLFFEALDDVEVLGFSGEEIDQLFGEYTGAEPVLEAGASGLPSDADGTDGAQPLSSEVSVSGVEPPRGISVPLLIQLSHAEMERWKRIKKECGETDNTRAFKLLVGMAGEEGK